VLVTLVEKIPYNLIMDNLSNNPVRRLFSVAGLNESTSPVNFLDQMLSENRVQSRGIGGIGKILDIESSLKIGYRNSLNSGGDAWLLRETTPKQNQKKDCNGTKVSHQWIQIVFPLTLIFVKKSFRE